MKLYIFWKFPHFLQILYCFLQVTIISQLYELKLVEHRKESFEIVDHINDSK